MPIGLRSTRPRRSRAWVRLSTDPESALPNARASSTMRLACSNTSPLPLSPFVPWYSVSIGTFPPSLARDDLPDDVPERERAREAQHRAFADELRRLVHCLVHRHFRLFDEPLRVFGAELAEHRAETTVSR